MNLAKLTSADGREVFVNTDEIVAMEGFQGFTRITFTSGTEMAVKESPHHIIGGLPDGGKRSAR